MHEPPKMNGHAHLQPPSVYDILYRIEGRLGGVESGLTMSHRTTLQAIETAFNRIATLSDRVSRLEAIGREPEEPQVSRLKYLSEVIPPIREILIAILVLAAGFGLAGAPPLAEVTQVIQAVKSSD